MSGLTDGAAAALGKHPVHGTREAWMQALITLLLPRYTKATGGKAPKIRVSVGRTSRKKYVGECWHAEMSDDKTREIFIRPDQADAVEVAGIIVHELVHAFLPMEAKHGATFKRLGESLGLEGKPTEMGPGKELRAELTNIVGTLGRFPHARLNMQRADKKQGTRLLKAMCAESGYVVRVTRQWLEMFGAPICPCCKSEMQEAP